jgi:hypothetical protein
MTAATTFQGNDLTFDRWYWCFVNDVEIENNGTGFIRLNFKDMDQLHEYWLKFTYNETVW